MNLAFKNYLFKKNQNDSDFGVVFTKQILKKSILLSISLYCNF